MLGNQPNRNNIIMRSYHLKIVIFKIVDDSNIFPHNSQNKFFGFGSDFNSLALYLILILSLISTNRSRNRDLIFFGFVFGFALDLGFSI